MFYIKGIILAFFFAMTPCMVVLAQKTNAANTPVTAYTVTEVVDKGLAGAEVYVKGIVSRIVSTNVAGDGWITYDISDDGKKKSLQLHLLRNYKGIDNEKWSDISDIGVKDNVVVFGKLVKDDAQNRFSLEYDNYLVSHVPFSPVMMDSETVDFTDVYYGETSSTKRLNTYSGMSFDAVFEKGTNSTYQPTYYTADDNIHLYKGNIMRIVSLTDKQITKIEMAYVRNHKDANLKVSTGSTSYNADNVLIWQMTVHVPEAALTVGEASRFTSVTVCYANGSEEQIYTRDITPGRVGTICLPYAVENGRYSGARFYETDYVKDGNLYFSEVSRLEAGMPYIFFSDGDATKIVASCSGTAATEAGNKNGLYGTFSPINISESDNIVVLSANALVLCGDGSSLAANRAYLKIDEVSTVPVHAEGARRVSFSLNGTPTGMDVVNSVPSAYSATYNIMGQRVLPATKGLVIRNGRKYVNK
ncbi:MAG: hypothetical protein NC344_04155 [Bacteroidales bacterium]|nr:hypothetical protein [Bacteroidales bacterium]MCM1147021.1 hypothetical protein [Bacteroidales bacterium]MCM1205846.1 hypothetical protein [Bacillota bacterium]MCM1509913.1 hypothetical protein [Clostridium sp.]